MSLTGLASSEILRVASPSLNERSLDILTRHAIDFGPKYSLTAENSRQFMTEVVKKASPEEEKQYDSSNALQSLVKYIPTESTTLYVAAMSAKDALNATISFFTPTFSYWFFAFLTPVLFLMIYVAKRRAKDLATFPQLRDFPWWKVVASIIAFLVWGLAFPSNPYSTTPLQGAAFAFSAVFVSTLL